MGPVLWQVIDPATGGESALLAAACACELPGLRHTCVVASSAGSVGVGALFRDALRVFSMGGIAEAAAPRIASALRSGELPEPDAVMAWSPAAMHLAARLFARRRELPILGVMPVGPWAAGLGAGGWLTKARLSACVRRGTLIPLTRPLEAAWAGALGLGATAIAPPVFVRESMAEERAALRGTLGIAATEVAVLLLANQPNGGDARRLAQVIGMAHMAGAPVVGLVHRGASHVERAARFHRHNRRAWEQVAFDGAAYAAIAAADLCVWDRASAAPGNDPIEHDAGILAIAAAAAGVPVVTVDDAAAEQTLGSCEFTRAKGRTEHDLAGVVLRLAEDVELRQRVGAASAARWAEPGRRWVFHEELAGTLRSAATNTATVSEWWASTVRGEVW